MKKQHWINTFVIGAFVFAFLIAVFPVQAQAFKSQQNSKNMVTVEVTPKKLSPNVAAVFKVSLNTHSVELNQDMAKVSSLIDDKGRVIAPDKWEGSPPGGHHRAGELVFPKLSGDIQSIKLIIKDIAGIPERIFEWNLEE